MLSSDDQRHLLHSGCSFVGFNGCAVLIVCGKAPHTCDEAQQVDRTSRLPSDVLRALHCYSARIETVFACHIKRNRK